MSTDQIIDQEAIENLRALDDGDGEDSFLKEVIEIFVSDTPERINELRTSFAADDQVTFTRAAHSIKGSSSNVGAIILGRLAKDLEADSRESIRGLGPRIDALDAAFLEAKRVLQAL
ncbi:Hpt domain-containing protein [Synoicihabitans lomoniglobus]|uniref:Hpt domain-containing protein n=1 Tax=Synoicihabitans lomoniglobus TaxID=2909285 RepID=A0AAF0CSB8_9BACT|nr:Hpt domain-containing protein [Opitutaceae bacterium LMO-M01]WED67128.1 Hpt domain-containing protein [Opitutaceae bacterium LMO-M01]